MDVEKCLSNESLSEDNGKHEEIRRRALSNLMDDYTDLKRDLFSKEHKECVDSYDALRGDVRGLARSASVAVLNVPQSSCGLDVEESKFFVKLKSSSREIRNIMWTMHERRQRKEAEEELMKCRKNRKAAIRSAKETVRATQDELSKATSLTILRGRLLEAQTNNKELKESIFHKMSDRSLVRLTAQPDMSRLVWQIVSLKSQITVLQDRLKFISDKLQMVSTVPSKLPSSESLSKHDASSTVQPKLYRSKSKTGWHLVSRIFGNKKVKN